MESDLLVATAYNEDASQNYDGKRFVSASGKLFHKMEVAQLATAISSTRSLGRVLEVGCGTGRFIAFISSRAEEIVGVDPSPHMLEIAKARCDSLSNVTFLEAEGRALHFADGTFDFVYSIRVINQTESEEYALELVKELIRVTKPGGRTLIEFCNKWRPRRLGKQGIRLSIPQMFRFIEQIAPEATISHSGILVLSETLLHRVPTVFLGAFERLDAVLSSIFPKFAARCYLLVAIPE